MTTEMAKVGVRTRAQALAMAASASSRKRKSSAQRIFVNVELRRASRKRRVVDNEDDRLDVSDRSDSASCCSTNGSTDHDRTIIKFADLQTERSVEVETSVYCSCRDRRETTPSSQHLREESIDEVMDSTKTQSSTEADSRHISTTAAQKMPTEAELDEFFAEAEKNIQKQFADKYNYDIVKDEPLKGRYEWVQLTP